MDRLDMLTGPAKLPRKISEYIRSHMYVTPSGLFSHYLRWALEVLGTDHVLMSTDYPFVPMEEGSGPRAFLQAAAIGEDARQQIASGNWDRLCAEMAVIVHTRSSARVCALQSSCVIVSRSRKKLPSTSARFPKSIGIAAIQATFGRSFYFSVLAHLPKPRTGYASPSAAGSPSRSNWNWQPTS